MSDEKPLPCPFCHNPPHPIHLDSDEWCIEFKSFTPRCPCRTIFKDIVGECFITIAGWNRFCEMMLAIRRKDFEAGRVTIAFNRDNVGGDWLEIKTFDDYIKEQHDRAK